MTQRCWFWNKGYTQDPGTCVIDIGHEPDISHHGSGSATQVQSSLFSGHVPAGTSPKHIGLHLSVDCIASETYKQFILVPILPGGLVGNMLAWHAVNPGSIPGREDTRWLGWTL